MFRICKIICICIIKIAMHKSNKKSICVLYKNEFIHLKIEVYDFKIKCWVTSKYIRVSQKIGKSYVYKWILILKYLCISKKRMIFLKKYKNSKDRNKGNQIMGLSSCRSTYWPLSKIAHEAGSSHSAFSPWNSSYNAQD